MMDRIKSGGYSSLIEAAYEHIPLRLQELIRPHVLTGTDPVFAGLHAHRQTDDGRSYAATAHVAYEHHQPLPRSRRHVTVVLPGLVPVAVVVHELGHVLHQRIGFDYRAIPVSQYAETNHHEAFADAFAAWALPFGHSFGAAKDRLYEVDRATIALFEVLS